MTDAELIADLRGKGFGVMEKAADRIEALTTQLKTVLDREAATHFRHDAKTGELEAKLAKAVEAADRMLDAFCVHETQEQVEAYDSMNDTLAAIEGEKP
jgi:hypothetical protein